MLLSVCCRAQTLHLDTATFYPDSNIVHTGKQVRWTGIVNWGTSLSAAYTLTYSFGDGSGYTVSKFSGSNVNGDDTFRASHSYLAAGLYTAKVVVKNALGAATDSLVRPFSVGSGTVVSGRVYYDCTQDCQPDSTELSPGNGWIGIRVNRVQRRYLTDSLGYYNMPFNAGDTIMPNITPDAVNTAVATFCLTTPFTAASRAAHIPLWLKDEMYMSNLRVPGYACKGAQTLLLVSTHRVGGGDPRVKVDYGDGWVTPYLQVRFGDHDFHYSYSRSGTFRVFVDLYTTNFAGPFMRFTRIVHVDSCRSIVLEPVHDANRNCLLDSSEAPPEMTTLTMRSKLLGTNYASYLSPGRFAFLHFPGDTSLADTVLNFATSTYNDTVRLRRNCIASVITDQSADSVVLPYGTHLRLRQLIPPAGTICYADSLQFTLRGPLLRYPAGTRFRLFSDYGDGHIDTLVFSSGSDTLNLMLKHRYDTSGLRNCLFVLEADNGDTDSIRHQIRVNNCFPIFVRAFYDRNRNCSRDSGEAFSWYFSLGTGSYRTYSSNPATGEIKIIQYDPEDSVVEIIDQVNQSEQGYYSRAMTSRAGCSWPRLTIPGSRQDLPLLDTPVFPFSYANVSFRACNPGYTATFYTRVDGNHGNAYTLVFYPGDGRNSDSFRLTSRFMRSYAIPTRNYDPGYYQPSYRIYDDSTGRIVSRGKLPPFRITDTCAGKGQLYIDSDGDCSFSTADIPLAAQPVRILSGGAGITVLTDAEGRFFTPLSAGSDSVRVPDTLGASQILSCGAVNTAWLQPGVNRLFPYSCAAGNDLGLIAAHRYFRNSTADTLILYPSGHSCHDEPGTLRVELPAGLSFTGASIPGGVLSGSGISWSIDTLRKLPSVIRIGLSCNPVPGTEVLCISASLSAATPDPEPAGNDFYLCDSVRLALPDYYKSLSSDSMDANGELRSGKELIYSIRVRNGSPWDTFRSVTIYDTLDTRLDPGTLHLLDADFPYVAQLLSGNVLRVSSSGNMALVPGADLAVRFGIMPRPGLASGTVISNQVSVALDGVPEGSSNTVYGMAARQAPTALIPVPASAPGLTIYPVPVPTDGRFRISVPDSPTPAGRFELLDARGAVCRTGRLDGRHTWVSAENLPPGLYLIRVVTGTGIFRQKIVVAGTN